MLDACVTTTACLHDGRKLGYVVPSPRTRYDYATHWRKNFPPTCRPWWTGTITILPSSCTPSATRVSEPAKDEGVERTKEMVAFLKRKRMARPSRYWRLPNLMIIANAKRARVFTTKDGMNNDVDKMQGMNSTMFNMITNMVAPV